MGEGHARVVPRLLVEATLTPRRVRTSPHEYPCEPYYPALWARSPLALPAVCDSPEGKDASVELSTPLIGLPIELLQRCAKPLRRKGSLL